MVTKDYIKRLISESNIAAEIARNKLKEVYEKAQEGHANGDLSQGDFRDLLDYLQKTQRDSQAGKPLTEN